MQSKTHNKPTYKFPRLQYHRIDWLGDTVTGVDGASLHAAVNKFPLFCKFARNSTEIAAVGFIIRCK